MNFLKKISPENWFRFILGAYLILAVIAGIQSYIQTYEEHPQYTCYNNFVIFKQSHFHLNQDKDLYKLYPEEHWDLYKYSPAFSLFFGAFSYFPSIMGLNLWNILNSIVFFLAIYLLPNIRSREKIFILIFCIIELMTSLQNEQSNALVAGMIILAFGLLEKKNYLLATFLIVGSVYIKIFGVVAMALYLLYPNKLKLTLYSIFWVVILFFIPLIVVNFNQLKFLYESWFNLLMDDHSMSYGISVMGFITSWFGLNINKIIVVIIGIALFLIPLLQIKKYQFYKFRLLVLSSVLIWVIIFNHKAESSTFIIALSGVAIWFFLSEKSILNNVLIISAFILVSLSPTDIFPNIIRDKYVIPLALKAVPCIFIWFKILYDMFSSVNILTQEPSIQTSNSSLL